MKQYPYYTAQILNDGVALKYGLHTGTSTQEQRDIAYLLAEEQMTEYLDSMLLPTTVSGTYFWRGKNPIELDYGHILGVLQVSINSMDWANGCTIHTVTGCHILRNEDYGYLDINWVMSCGGCQGILGLPPYNVTVIYQSGFATGTATQPAMLQALTLAAQINLNEMDISLSNESTADIGVQNFTNQQYSETRFKLSNSAFGNSPTAMRIARLVRKYRSKPSIGLH